MLVLALLRLTPSRKYSVTLARTCDRVRTRRREVARGGATRSRVQQLCRRATRAIRTLALCRLRRAAECTATPLPARRAGSRPAQHTHCSPLNAPAILDATLFGSNVMSGAVGGYPPGRHHTVAARRSTRTNQPSLTTEL